MQCLGRESTRKVHVYLNHTHKTKRKLKLREWPTFEPVAWDLFWSSKGLKSSRPRAALFVTEATDGSWKNNILTILLKPCLKRPASRNWTSSATTDRMISGAKGNNSHFKYLRRTDFLNLLRMDYHQSLPFLSFPSIKGAKRGFIRGRCKLLIAEDFQVCAWVRGKPSCDLKCDDVISKPVVAINGTCLRRPGQVISSSLKSRYTKKHRSSFRGTNKMLRDLEPESAILLRRWTFKRNLIFFIYLLRSFRCEVRCWHTV